MSTETLASLGVWLSGLIAFAAYMSTALKGLRQEFRTDITKLDVKVDRFRAELKADIADLRDETRSGLTTLRHELMTDIADLRQETRSGLTALRDELKTDIADLRDETHSGLTTLRHELKTDIATLRDETKADTHSLREETRSGFVRLEARIDKVQIDLKDELVNFRDETKADIRELRVGVARLEERVFQLAAAREPQAS